MPLESPTGEPPEHKTDNTAGRSRASNRVTRACHREGPGGDSRIVTYTESPRVAPAPGLGGAPAACAHGGASSGPVLSAAAALPPALPLILLGPLLVLAVLLVRATVGIRVQGYGQRSP